MDLVEFTYDCYGKKITVKNPKYFDGNGKRIDSNDVSDSNTLYKKNNILDSYLILGNNGSGKTTFFKKLSRITNSKYIKNYLKDDINVFFDKGKYVEFYDYIAKNDISMITIKKDYNSKGYGILVNDKKYRMGFKQSELLDFMIEDLKKETNKSVLNFSVNREVILNLHDKHGITLFKKIINFLDLIKNNNNLVIIMYIYISLLNSIISKCLETNFQLIIYLSDTLNFYDELKEFIEEEIINAYINDVLKNIDIYNDINDIEFLKMLYDSLMIRKYDINVNVSILDFLNINDYKKYIKEKILTKHSREKNRVTYFFESLIEKYKNQNNNLFSYLYRDDSNFDKLYFKLDNVVSNEVFKEIIVELFELNEFCYLENSFSAGEQSLMELIACITTAIEKIDKNSIIMENEENHICYLLLDEIEQNLHPEWCRVLYSKIVETINSIDTNYKFYIYMSTHSPYVISDFTSDHIIYLNEENRRNNFETFGANIHDILSKGMFLHNPMGQYSYDMIKKVHNALLNAKNKDDAIEKSGLETVEKLIYFIDCIGEPLIKIQLKNLWNNIEYKFDAENILKSLNNDEIKKLYEKAGEMLHAKD